MSAENTQNQAMPQQLNDSELEMATGGMDVYHDWKNDKYYKWYGGNNTSHKYRCPNCGRLLHEGLLSVLKIDIGARYFCDACDEQWFYESKLTLNVGDGLWQEISFEQWVQENGGHGTH